MLLPSALSCDAQSHSPFSKRPTARKMLLSSPPPRPACQSPLAPSTNLFAACGALQSLLANTLPLSTKTTTPQAIDRTLDSPIHFTAPLSKAQAQPQKRHPSRGPPVHYSQHTPPPAPSRKRRRDSTPSRDLTTDDKENRPATPKRKRRCPPHPTQIALQPLVPTPQQQQKQAKQEHPTNNTLTPLQRTPTTTFVNPYSHPAPQLDNRPLPPWDWTQADENALVSTILQKLQLRQCDWDDCAKQIGSDSIGERFRALVGDEMAAGGLLKRRGGGWRRGKVEELGFGFGCGVGG